LFLGFKAWRAETKSKNIFLLTALAGIIAWLVAGVVEYSFGDSEVTLILYAVVAYLLSQLNPFDELRAGPPASNTNPSKGFDRIP
jgi:hypothetical protein